VSLPLRPAAAYDIAATAIRMTYDPQPDRFYDDPVLSHELAHYGQDISTALGIAQSWMAHELYVATVDLLEHWTGELRLPLARHVNGGDDGGPADAAVLALCFDSQVGMLGHAELRSRQEFVQRHGPGIRSAAWSSERPNPFFVAMTDDNARMVVRGDADERMSIDLDGRYIQEIHALSVQLMARWYRDRLSVDDAFSYFISLSKSAYFLPSLMISRTLTERYGKGIFDAPGALLVCHLCAQIALNAPVLAVLVEGLPVRVLTSGPLAARYLDPGVVFVHMLRATLESMAGGEDLERDYFRLMASALTRLGWPQFDEIMQTTLDQLVMPLLRAAEESGAHAALRTRKLRDAAAACRWLMDRAESRDVLKFLVAPSFLIADGVVPGPLIVGPVRPSMLTPEQDPASPRDAHRPAIEERYREYLDRLITFKLWNEEQLTCVEPSGSPVRGSAVGCVDPRCRVQATAESRTGACRHEDWIATLRRYRGLRRHLPAE